MTFDVKYLGYDNGAYEYSITNKTNSNIDDVYATVSVGGIKKFKISDYVKYSIHQGETITYRIYTDDIIQYAKENGYASDGSAEGSIYIADVEIVGLKWN